MVFDKVVEPLLHLLGGLGEPLLVQRVYQHDLVVDQRCSDRRAAIGKQIFLNKNSQKEKKKCGI